MVETLDVNGRTVQYETVREWRLLKVIEINFPGKTKGAGCLWDEDTGEYRIFLNSALSDEEKLKTFIHEMVHLYHGDFTSNGDVQEKESRCHSETKKIIESLEHNRR